MFAQALFIRLFVPVIKGGPVQVGRDPGQGGASVRELRAPKVSAVTFRLALPTHLTNGLADSKKYNKFSPAIARSLR